MSGSLSERIAQIWEGARHEIAAPRTQLAIPHNRVVPPKSRDCEFHERNHYFQVRLNQMFLAYQREWFVRYDPAALVITQFLYGQEFVSIPFFVGPSLFETAGVKAPNGAVIVDTRVAGLHPYQGDRLILTIILYKTQRDNAVRRLLGLIEKAAGAIDYSTSLLNYLRVADVIINGIEGLLGLGQTVPVLAYRKEFDPQAGEPLKENYFVLIDKPENAADQSELCVIDNKLYKGGDRTTASAYTAEDFVLFSLLRSDERNDVDRLPFYSLWERALKEAVIPDEAHWKLAKSYMLALYQSLVLSPDLTEPQVTILKQKYTETLRQRHNESVELSDLGSSGTDPTRLEELKDELSILDM